MAHDSIRETYGKRTRRAAGIRQLFASRRRGEQISQLGIVLVRAIGALAMLLPFVWMLATSLSRSANVAMPRIPRLWPADPSLFNYQVAITNLPLPRFYLNSIIVATSATLGYLLFSSLAGYAFAKGRFVGKNALFILLLTTLMIPFEIRMLPLYSLMRTLHLNNTLLALIVPWRWNDVLWPLLVLSDRKLYTVTLGLAVAGRSQGTFTGVALANAALAILPIIGLYVLLQRYIIRGV